MATDVLFYRPQACVRAGSHLHFPGVRAHEDFSYDPALADMLAHWEGFQPLDRALVAAFEGTDFRQAGDELRRLVMAGVGSWGMRIAARMMDWADRHQTRRAALNPMFVHMKARLDRLVDEGLLVSSAAVLATASAPDGRAGVRASARLETAGITTCDRPDNLRRSLESLLRHARQHSRRLLVDVVDQSESASSRAANRSIADALAREYEAAIRLHDADARRDWIERFVARGIPRQAAADVVGGGSAGPETLNLLIFENVDQPLVIWQAGGVFEPLARRRGHDELTFSERASYAACLADHPAGGEFQRGGVDVLTTFERLLGQTLPAIADAWPHRSRIALGELGGHMLRAFLEQRGRTVVCGTGRIGQVSLDRVAEWWSTSAPLPRKCLPRALPRGRRGGDVGWTAMMPLGHVVSHRAEQPLGPVFALDNRSLTAPLLSVGPAGPRADPTALFRVLLHNCVQDGYVAHVPSALADTTDQADLDGPGSDRRHLPFALVVEAALTLADLGLEGLDTAERLRRAGTTLVECGRLTSEAFDEQLRRPLLRTTARELADWESLHRTIARRQPTWARTITGWIDARVAAARRGESAIASELFGGGDVAAARRLTLDKLTRIGQVLRWWPAMLEVARDVKTRGGES